MWIMKSTESSTSTEIKICPECKGEGKVEKYIRTEHSQGNIYETEKCKRCKGTGRIVITTIISEEAYNES